MSMPITLETAPALTTRARLVAWPAVTVARGLAKLSPHRLRAVLRFLSRGGKPASYEQALRARRSVVAVSRRCAAEQCLQRSIATAVLCRLRGTWPEWCTGIRTEPFRAHAWVAVDGAPVGERNDISLFRPVIRVGPAGRRA